MNVPELTPLGQERKREQDEYNRVSEQINKVDVHIAIAKKNAKRATEMITKKINETTAWLEECDVKIGELKTKIAKDGGSDEERDSDE